MSRKRKQEDGKEATYIVVPKDFSTTPFFTVLPLENRSFIAGSKRWDFNVPLTIEHGAVLYNILSFKDPFNPSREIEFTVCDLCQRMFASDNAANLEKTKDLLLQLDAARVRIVDLETNKYQIIRLIEKIKIEGELKNNSLEELATNRIRGVVLDNTLVDMLERTAEISGLNLQEFNSIRSKIAKAIYNYIPSRANYHDEQDPFEISLVTLFHQLNISGYDTKSKRRQLMTQNKNSVIKQLDGRKVTSGKLRMKLHETRDKKDHKLMAWTEKKGVPPWANTSISSYETELLQRSNVNLEKCGPFLKKAKFILGEGIFQEILAESKNKALEGKEPIKSETARLIDTFTRAIESSNFNFHLNDRQEKYQPGLFDPPQTLGEER